MNERLYKKIKILVILTILFFSFMFIIRSTNYEKANVKFCNEQGWGYSSGGSKDRTEIWCGVMTNDNGEYGFQGVIYPVKKKFFGGYEVKEGFDVNLDLEKQRFYEYCKEECKKEGTIDLNSIFETLQCECMNISTYDGYMINPNYHDVLSESDVE